MGNSVKLYVYDLSNGLAKQLSMQLTGRQIDGIWHTSVVVFGKEIFYGQGICTTMPGQSHHGQPLQVIDMGETALDEETFNDYIQEMNSIYTADKYHLLDFNCNSFTNDCIGFLTGGSIPSWIRDLPADFLSTPFGAALRPTIDSMFRRPTPGAVSPQPYSQPMASSLLQSVAAQASGPSAAPRNYLPTPAATPSPQPAAATVAAPLQICSNLQHFRNILSSHRAVSAFFTSRTCPPCRIVEPVFEDLAAEKSSKGVAFVKIDLSAMFGGQVAGAYGVTATPTFLFFLDGKKVHELKGANVPELKSQVDLLIFQAFPPHPHAIKKLPAIRAISLEPILFTQVPALDTVQSKLLSFIDGTSNTTFSDTEKERAKKVLSSSVIPFLKTRTDAKLKNSVPSLASTKKVCEDWTTISTGLVKALPQAQLFPLVDLWRIGLLDNSISSWCASTTVDVQGMMKNPVLLLLSNAASGDMSTLPKPVILTTLRMLSNAFANVTLARTLLNPSSPSSSSSSLSARQMLTILLVSSLLHEDSAVRTAAASLAFNVSLFYQKPRVEAARSGRRGEEEGEGESDGEWEVEVVSAVVEALRTEVGSEDVVHRLTASLAFFLHLSPSYETQLKPLLEVLQARDVLKAKLKGGLGGCGEKGVGKKDVRMLVSEVADELCC
ncbi:DUF862-domain-containing protein [Fomitiporia mediterranea MF3/22]|uniref:DUF862-domain-containing protein n=1 Tax=Fomitiporia mediterranea (strain MF3/22) TaxID=694068 RepID=UPI000440918D|nr:DUF862-domain-containing protein [Fomitiporia mediterranea MF3/22]EJC97999.1 DUF862-domain-containing protein [Fomitiporia mediterranea MF3/22]